MLKVKRFLLFSVEACAYMLGASLVSGWEASECFPSKFLMWMWFFQKVKLWGIRFFLHLELGVTNQHPKASTAQVWFLKLSPTLAVSWLFQNWGGFYVKPHPPEKKIVYREVSLHVGQGWSSGAELSLWTFPLGIWWIWCSRKLPLATDEILIFYFFFEGY